MSAWENYNGPFNFDATLISPMGCPVIIHNNPSTRKYSDFRGRTGFNINPELNHYRCFCLAYSVTKALLFSDTVEFMHDYLSQPTDSESDRIACAIKFFSCAGKDATATICYEQLTALEQDLLEKLLKVHDYCQCPLTPGIW